MWRNAIIVLLFFLLCACAARQGIVRKAEEDIPSPVTRSPLPCLFFRW